MPSQIKLHRRQMANESVKPTREHGVMEGNGQYNKHARLPAQGASFGLPVLERAMQELDLPAGDDSIVIADYGSSQGKNSMSPMQVAIRALKRRIARHRPITVFHIDQPSNDFNSLFEVLHTDSASYAASEPNVFSAAIGKSFYEQVLPSNMVHLGWSSYAAMWLSRLPAQIPEHFIACCGPEDVRAEFDRQARLDWERFLSLRAKELRDGGRLVVVVPGINDDGSVGLEALFDQTNAVLDELVADGTITFEERSRMALQVHPRRRAELLLPFRGGTFHALRLISFDVFEVPDVAWEEYERDGDVEALSAKRALFLRAVFAPSLAGALNTKTSENGSRAAAFADKLEQRLKRRIASHTAPMNTPVQVMQFAKKN